MSKAKTIAVIGGGSAGFTAARTAFRLGAKVLFFMGENADHKQIVLFEQSGHWPDFEEPEKYRATLIHQVPPENTMPQR